MINYQVCFNRCRDYFIPEYYGKQESTVVCYETDSKFDAQCYINEMHHLGDYTPYFIKEVNK